MWKRLKKNIDIILITGFILGLGFSGPLFVWSAAQWGTSSIQNGAITNMKVAPGISAEKIGADTSVSDTEYGYLNGVTGSIQGQINGKANSADTVTDTNLAAAESQLRAEMATDTDLAGKEPAIATGADTEIWYGNKTWGAPPATGSASFGELTDVDTYAGHGGEYVKVKAGANGIEYGSPSGAGDMTKAVYDLDDDGRVDSAEVVTDGTNYSTAAQIKAAVDNTPTDAQIVLWDATGADSANKVTGSGTAGKLPMFTGANTLGDSGQTDTQARTKHIRFAILDASTLVDTTICLIPKLASAITVTGLNVVCGTDPDTEIAGDILYADTSFIAKGSPTVINSFDTSAGIRDDTSIDTPAVASGKCVYWKFDTTPIAAVKMISADITYTVN